MKYRRFGAILLLLSLLGSLFACAAEEPQTPLPFLNGTRTEYSPTVAYAEQARDGVEIGETAEGHVLKNKTARLDFGEKEEGLLALTSLQTGETLLKNTVITTLTAESGKIATVTGGAERVEQGRYGIGHHRVEGDLSLPADASQATEKKGYDLTGKSASAFSALKNDVSVSSDETGLTVTSSGKNRSQFGAKNLKLDLEEHDHYYLSVNLKSSGVTGIKCFFATDDTPLTEQTALGTLALTDSDQFVTLTAEIDNRFWDGTLQTLLFRLPEGEEGSVTLSRIAILTADDAVDPGVADTLWTVYSDRIYFSQTMTFGETKYTAASTVIAVKSALCKEIVESPNAVGLKMIDGSVLGFVRPASGATVRVERTEEEIRVILDWDLTAPTPSLALRMDLNYADGTDDLERLAQQERNPLTAADFIAEGATFDRYDPRGGMYRFTRTAETVSITAKGNDRTVYLHLPPAEGTAWRLCDKDGTRLPVFAGDTVPLCTDGKDLTVRLIPETAPQALEDPPFFPDSGLIPVSRTSTLLNGLCAQNTAVYAAADGTYSVTLTSTKLTDEATTVYDVRYDFHGKKQVSDLLKAFPFFSFELTYGFEEYEYLNGENTPVALPAGQEEVAYLGSMPYVSLRGETEQAGFLITKCAMTAGGTPSTALTALRYEEVSEHHTNRLFLSFDAGETDFVRGDSLTVQVIRTESADREALEALRNGGNFNLIRKETKPQAPLQITGMESTVILQIEGYENYTLPSLKANGEPFTPALYQVYVDENGYYGFAFPVNTGTQITVE